MMLTPLTCADSFYALGGSQPHSMNLLTNLVPANDTASQWVARPAALQLTGSFPSDMGFVSAHLIVGTRFFGMYASQTLFPGRDVPFCYDLLGAAMVSISGVTSGNTPASAPSSGTWTPPHMEMIGTKIIVSHVGFSGAGQNFVGQIETANPTALAWTCFNTLTNALPSVPVWVSQFFQRAYYFCNIPNQQPALIGSDVLLPGTRSYSGYVLTFGDNIPLLCGGTVGLDTQQSGQVQTLVVFKQGAEQMWQVQGDFAWTTQTSTTPVQVPPVYINNFSKGTGTNSPNSVCPTPKGLAFVAPDGVRILDFDGHVSDPIGYNGQGICQPLIAAAFPSRIAAACNGVVYRVTTQNSAVPGTPWQDWCLDLVRQIWHGPHSFAYSLLDCFNNVFVSTSPTLPGLWQNDLNPSVNSTYVENGNPYNCIYQSALMPDRETLNELACAKAVFYQGFGAGTTAYNIAMLDQNGSVIDSVDLQYVATQTLWDQFTWGVGVWLGSNQNLRGTEIPWHYPLCFDRMTVRITVQAAAGLRLGNVIMDIEQLGYTVSS